MKLKITKPDGTVIEAEGTAEECERLVHRDALQVAPLPFITPIVTEPLTWPPTIAPDYGPWWGVEPPSYLGDRYWQPFEFTCSSEVQ